MTYAGGGMGNRYSGEGVESMTLIHPRYPLVCISSSAGLHSRIVNIIIKEVCIGEEDVSILS